MVGLEHENERRAASEARRWAFLFAALTAALCVALVLMMRANGRLREQLEVLAASKAREGGLDLGAGVAPIRLTDSGGASVGVSFEGESVGTLLLFHASGCDACAATGVRWREIVAASRRPDVRVVCVQTDGEAGLVALEGLPPSLAVPLPPAGWLASLPAVPATLLVDDRGELAWAEYGELDAAAARDLSAAIAALGMLAPGQNAPPLESAVSR